MNDVYIWRCTRGHESAHSETEIRNLIILPRCGLMINGEVCMALLARKIRRLGEPPGVSEYREFPKVRNGTP